MKTTRPGEHWTPEEAAGYSKRIAERNAASHTVKTTRRPRYHLIQGADGRPIKVPYILPWYKAPLLMAVLGAVWLAICIVALTAILTLADAWVKGG